MSTTTRIPGDELAAQLRDLAFDFPTRVNYDLADGIHAKTYCATILQIGELIANLLGYEDESKVEAFYEAAGLYEVAKHPSMADFPYVLERAEG